MWNYNDKVMEHFLHPQNVGELDSPDGFGEVGNVSCGDALRLTFKLDDEGRIAEVKFKTFGCVSAIASSSALTELVKGMTLEEAEKVTNQDIVALLGVLPEEKMHCSVMGMEALQAAIADYRGETTVHEDDGSDEGKLVCKCFGITDAKIIKVAKENNLHSAAEITNYCKAGGACGACLDEIQDIVDDLWANRTKVATESDFASLPVVQKVIKVQEVIDKEIAPILAKDGGSIELLDIQGNTVVVRLTGQCSGCPSAGATLKFLVQEKLQEYVSSEILVENKTLACKI